MTQPETCIGSAQRPRDPHWEQDGTTTGICPVCGERLELDAQERIPEHEQPA